MASWLCYPIYYMIVWRLAALFIGIAKAIHLKIRGVVNESFTPPYQLKL